MKPFLFLDVDGVLNTRESFKRGEELDDMCCRRLRRIIADADPEVVLSSTWRLYPPHAKRVWKIIGKRCKATPDGRAGRGEQIAAFLVDFPGRPYVILDDDVFDLLPEQAPFIVQTVSEEGLTDKKADEILRLFDSFKGIDK
jgi:hypothetical protein